LLLRIQGPLEVSKKTYFVVNDTRYDNHHGGWRVMANLHLGMERRGWQCSGSLPVSAQVQHLKKHSKAISESNLILVNGEGSLHHNSRNAMRLFEIMNQLRKQGPVVLLNALWQDNDPEQWRPLLSDLSAVYTRDRRSQSQLEAIGINAAYAPDLTFYNYPDYSGSQRSRYMITDSVLKKWDETAYAICQRDPECEFRTLLTRRPNFSRGSRDWGRQLKFSLYPYIFERFGSHVPPRYRVVAKATNNSEQFLQSLAAYRGICAARYHALCFAIQQQVPMLFVSSNSHKSEALIEEIGLPQALFKYDNSCASDLKQQLQQVSAQYANYAERVKSFNSMAKEKIETMFDHIVDICD
jgi:hypothetical protein